MNYIIIALLGALSSILSNRGIAIFNDALRPILPEYQEGRMDKKALVATSFALSFGLVIGFGIPFSIGKKIILIHSILLGTDIIGIWSPNKKILGILVSGILGALYGILLLAGLEAVVDLFSRLPLNFLPALGKVGSPIIAAFALFPALVVAYQYGSFKGSFTFVLTLLARQFFSYYGSFVIGAGKVSLNADGMALLVGMLVMLIFAIQEKPSAEGVGANEQLVGIFAQRVQRIRKNIWFLAPMGGLVAAATSLGTIAGDPISLNLLAEFKQSEAGFVSLARGIGFIPLLATTAIATGVYGPGGMTFVFPIGIFIGNPVFAFFAGALMITTEVLLLTVLAKFLDKFPGVRACGNHIRTAMSGVLAVALLIGGVLAANAMVPSVGFFFVIGIYLMNKVAKKPIIDMAVGPIAAIIFGILVNILSLVGLFQVPLS